MKLPPILVHVSHHRRVLSAIGIGLLAIVVAAGIYGSVSYINYQRAAGAVSASLASAKQVDGKVAAANNQFGMHLFDALVKESPNDNICISPASVSLLLSMFYNGAGSDTRRAMQQTLSYQGIDIRDINKSNSALLASLQTPDFNVTLNVANSVWLSQRFSVNQRFVSTVKDAYGAEIQTLRFGDDSSTNTINQWVDAKTNHKIPTIIDRTDPDAVLYAINAIYFNGQWSDKFDTTEDATFTTTDGNGHDITLMSKKATYDYYENDDVQAIALPYGKNQRLSMHVYLPGNMQQFLASLSNDKLAEIDTHLFGREGTILLPKFTLTYGKDLVDSLAKLGMGPAFSADTADFGGIAPNSYLSEVIHKTYVSVDQDGTTAAAVTEGGLMMGSNIQIEDEGFTMRVDHPFVWTINDSATSELLFVGAVQSLGT